MFVQFERRFEQSASVDSGDFFMKIWGDFSSLDNTMEESYQARVQNFPAGMKISSFFLFHFSTQNQP